MFPHNRSVVSRLSWSLFLIVLKKLLESSQQAGLLLLRLRFGFRILKGYSLF
jgi:hypothetical protein